MCRLSISPEYSCGMSHLPQDDQACLSQTLCDWGSIIMAPICPVSNFIYDLMAFADTESFVLHGLRIEEVILSEAIQ